MAPPTHDESIRPRPVCSDFLHMREARREYGRSRRRGRRPALIGVPRLDEDLAGVAAIAKRHKFNRSDLDQLLAGADDDQLADLRRVWISG